MCRLCSWYVIHFISLFHQALLKLCYPDMDFPWHSGKVLEQLNQQRQLGLLCDCTFVVDGIDFKAHKAVLAACSAYFRTLFLDQKDVVHLDISNAAGTNSAKCQQSTLPKKVPSPESFPELDRAWNLLDGLFFFSLLDCCLAKSNFLLCFQDWARSLNLCTLPSWIWALRTWKMSWLWPHSYRCRKSSMPALPIRPWQSPQLTLQYVTLWQVSTTQTIVSC